MGNQDFPFFLSLNSIAMQEKERESQVDHTKAAVDTKMTDEYVDFKVNTQ